MKSAFELTCKLTAKQSCKKSIEFVVMIWLVIVTLLVNLLVLVAVILLKLEALFASYSFAAFGLEFILVTVLYFWLVTKLKRAV